MNLIRTRIGKDIVCEVALPARRSKRAIILLDGMPSVPSKKTLLATFAKKGFWVFHPRYRGAWESSGEFLKKSPEEDVAELLDRIPRGFVDLWSGETIVPEIAEWSLIGVSFGGPAALLAARDARINRVIAISPVVDWTAPSKAEPLDWLYGFVRDAFGEGYRVTKRDWNKLARGTFYNPAAHIDEIPGEKIWMFHARDDESVLYKPVEKFAKRVGAKLTLYKRGGHLSSLLLIKPAQLRRIVQFLRGK